MYVENRIDMLTREVGKHPGSLTPVEIKFLTDTALNMPSNIRVRFGATRLYYYMREAAEPDARTRTTNVEIKFSDAQKGLRAIEKIADHNPLAVNPVMLEEAQRREKEILAIRPYRLT